jgi:hypothetical protein
MLMLTVLKTTTMSLSRVLDVLSTTTVTTVTVSRIHQPPRALLALVALAVARLAPARVQHSTPRRGVPRLHGDRDRDRDRDRAATSEDEDDATDGRDRCPLGLGTPPMYHTKHRATACDAVAASASPTSRVRTR